MPIVCPGSRIMRLSPLFVLALSLVTACAGRRHPSFTSDNVLTLKVGMTTTQIVALFGPPDRTRSTTCGTQTPSPWQCLIWEYELGPHPQGRYKSTANTNRLTFESSYTPPRLNSWDIDLMYRSR